MSEESITTHVVRVCYKQLHQLLARLLQSSPSGDLFVLIRLNRLARNIGFTSSRLELKFKAARLRNTVDIGRLCMTFRGCLVDEDKA